MNITKEDVLCAAKIANLNIKETELDFFVSDINDFLSFTEQLDEVDVSDVLPTVSTVLHDSILRDDITNSCENNNISDSIDFTVPKIME